MRRSRSATVPQPGRLRSCAQLLSIVWYWCRCIAVLLLILPQLSLAIEQAEVEYAKGIEEYGRGNYAEAQQRFQAAVHLVPEDANAQFYLGVAHNRLSRYDAAIPPLETALKLDPAMRYAHYHLGLAYFQQQRYPEALEQLQRATAFDPENAAAQFYQGYTLYQLKRYPEALAALEHTAQLDPTLAPAAQFYRGASHYELGNDARARTAFEAVQTTDPASPLSRNAQRYLEALQARTREQRWLQVDGSLSLQYDDNVILEPRNTSISRRADGSLIVNLSGELLPVRTPVLQAGVEYDFFQNLHFSLHDFDIRSHTFGVFGRLKLQPVTLRLRVNYIDTALNNAHFADTVGVQASALIEQTETLVGLVGVEYRHENFFGDVLSGQDPAVRSRDGYNVRVGFDQFWLFNKKQSYARVSYHYDAQRSEGSDWDYNGHEIGLGMQTPIGAGMSLDLYGTYYRFDYQNVNSFDMIQLGLLDRSDTRSRTDNRFTAGVALSRDLGRYLTVSAGYAHTSNHSNIAFFDYRRNLVTLAISGRY